MSEAGEAPTRRWWERGWRHLIALLLLALCGSLLWTSERGRSLTADEPLHMIRGDVYLWKHTARLSYAHPPLGNVITALPHAGRGEEAWGESRRANGEPRPKHSEAVLERMKKQGRAVPSDSNAEAIETITGWSSANPLYVSRDYFKHDFQRARAELTTSRRMMMLWTLLFAAFFYGWLDRRYGWPTAITALALFALHPTLLAHGRLVTTDMPATATTFASLTALIAWLERPSWPRAGLFLLATTAMVLTKHSGLMFVTVMSVVLIGAAILGWGGFCPARHPSRLKRTALVLGQLALIAVIMILVINAVYFFDRVGWSVAAILEEPEPHNWLARRMDYELIDNSPIAKLPEDWHLPFPYSWLAGLATVARQNAMGHGNYFFGVRGSSGHPLYFPVMIFAKTPTGVLALLGAAAVLAVRRLRRGLRPSLTTTVLLVFGLLFLASLMSSSINIGVRHAMPLFPILLIFAGRAGALLITGGHSERAAGRPGAGPDHARLASEAVPRLLRAWRGKLFVALCLLGSVAGAAWTFPNYLGDFNALVGGPAGGRYISVVGEDWGQDLGDVAELADEMGWERVAYFTPFPLRREELESRGLKVRKIGCDEPYEGLDPVLIHMSDWYRRANCFEWITREPDFIINHNMLVFGPDPVRLATEEAEAMAHAQAKARAKARGRAKRERERKAERKAKRERKR